MIALGVGPDGHIASLFPNRPELAEASRWVLPVTSSPKPPPERITMTLPVINAAKEVLVIALGDGKAEVVARALEVQALPGALPAQLVRPKGGRARWVLDAGSAAQLKHAEWESGKVRNGCSGLQRVGLCACWLACLEGSSTMHPANTPPSPSIPPPKQPMTGLPAQQVRRLPPTF